MRLPRKTKKLLKKTGLIKFLIGIKRRTLYFEIKKGFVKILCNDLSSIKRFKVSYIRFGIVEARIK